MPVAAPRALKTRIDRALSGPYAVAASCLILLGAHWLGGEQALIAAALLLPPAIFGLSAFGMGGGGDEYGVLLTPEKMALRIDGVWGQTETSGLKSAILCLEFDEYSAIQSHYGQHIADAVTARLGKQLVTALRKEDSVSRTSDSRFTALLSASSLMDLEACIQLCARLQKTLEEPVQVDGVTIYVSLAIGFCLRNRAPGPDGTAWWAAAETALTEARRLGTNTIRAYSVEMHIAKTERLALRNEAGRALDVGEIKPWFQPQISNDTGRVTGFEALARWTHPDRGLVSPGEFLPALEEAGLMERLAEVMLSQTLTALKAWDAAGADVPQVGVNVSSAELRNPRLVDKIGWELDRFDLAPHRLAIEVLETVVANTSDDIICRNLNGLSRLGCRIDLDDFGTGSASIAAIRRFSVGRIKIDRSFVMKADRDPEQQRMISAILTMAERLNVETLAEGVETVGEHALLAQLGCDHVQGFGIAKPMPFEQTLSWMTAHNEKLKDTPQIPWRKLS